MTSHERNYPIPEQELLALIYALKKWRHYLFGIQITAYTDHSSLATWEANRELSGRKARWHELLCAFPVKIIYRKGQLNIIADALSRREDLRRIDFVSPLENKEMFDTIRNLYYQDKHFCDIFSYFCDSSVTTPLLSCLLCIGIFLIRDRSYLTSFEKGKGAFAYHESLN
jgi:hypothetical protein